MTPPNAEQVTQALDGVQDPEIHRPITELGMVKNVSVGADGTVLVEVYLTVAGCPLREHHYPGRHHGGRQAAWRVLGPRPARRHE